MNTDAAPSKSAEVKIDRVIARLKRSYYLLTVEAEQRKSDAGRVIDFTVRDKHEAIVIRTLPATMTIAQMADDLSDEIKTVREAHAAAEEAAREAALNRPATPDEKRAFERLLDEHDWALARYARAAGKMHDKIANGEELYTSVHDELMETQGAMHVVRRLHYALLRNCSIVKTLAEIDDICDRETSFYTPSRSSSAASNVIEDHKHKAWLRMGRIARLRNEY